jgi:hypothetical protein
MAILLDTIVTGNISISGTVSAANDIVAKSIFINFTNSPPTPAANTLNLFCESIANRTSLAQIDPIGKQASIQAHLARNRIGYWNPIGNATTTPGVFGLTPPTANGTATARNIAATNRVTRSRRLGYVSLATPAGPCSGYRTPSAIFTLGTANGAGGFTYIHRFAVSDAVLANNPNMFIGLNTSVSAPANGAPNTTNCIGVAQIQGSNNYQMVYGGSSTQPAINLGSYGTWTQANNLTDFFELSLFSPTRHANASNTIVNYRFEKVDGTAANVATGTIEGPATVLPSNTTLLSIYNWRSGAAQAIATGLDLISIYIETDD